MRKISHQKHNKETFYFSMSRMLERVSFYGLRALIVLYMTGEILRMDSNESTGIYSWFIGSILISQVVGALLGDLLIGNKKAIYIGGVIQAIGALSLCIPSIIGLYLGLFLIVVGGGLYTPNIISNFGKSYLNKPKLLDAGFTLFYLVVNFGSMLGLALIPLVVGQWGYQIGFALTGILMLLSLVPIRYTNKYDVKDFQRSISPIGRRILNIVIALLAVGLFWGTFEISNIRIYQIQIHLSEIPTLNITNLWWQTINSMSVTVFALIAIVLWTYVYNCQLFKLAIGFILGSIAFAILLLIPEVPTQQHAIIYLISLLLLSASEIHIAPIIHSILTKYSNPKYLATFISLAFLPTKLFAILFGMFNHKFVDQSILGLKIGMGVMIGIGFGLIVYLIYTRRINSSEE
ncbi:POT-type proton-dependent oligopeptide transporter [Carboxylicivirga linearis]|uniref:MFS transporter n=1 Tax=Carboxylicivirga linearis TaxID=1628157 RepID=A0ABS5JU95_9BACT|nr:MFS transporter [Carboxylicivirga linearis]MBS2098412.1 MFS transporter [Carboxylicivirga linearis]